MRTTPYGLTTETEIVWSRAVPNIRFVFASAPNLVPNSIFVFGRIMQLKPNTNSGRVYMPSPLTDYYSTECFTA